jgi:peptidoglycan-associated lipoprotein
MKALNSSESHMKTTRPITLITVAVIALSFGLTGCKSKPQRTTTLYGQGSGRPGIAGDRSGMIGEGRSLNSGNVATENPTPATPSGIAGNETGTPQSSRNFENWFADSDVFKDQTIYFEYDKHNVKPSEVPKLKEVASRMKSFPGMALRIEGHCDERGTEEYNRALGDKRAQAIRELLASEGLDPTMMPTITFGEDKPADPGHSEAAFSKNRRGALILLSSRPHTGAPLTSELGESKAPRNSE